MEIFMDHPHNGARVAYSLAEAATWEAKGWKIRQDEAAPVLEQAPEPSKKPGRPRKDQS